MDWEREIRYRFRGEFIENDGDKLMLFELDEPEMIKVEKIVLPPKTAEESEGKAIS